MGCVNINSKEFKETSKRLDIDKGQLELIVYGYINRPGNEESFPSDDYIKRQVSGKSIFTANKDIQQVWFSKYGVPAKFTTREALNAYLNEVGKIFPSESVGVVKHNDGSYTVNVANPNVRTKTLDDLQIDYGSAKEISFEDVEKLYNGDTAQDKFAKTVFDTARKLGIGIKEFEFEDTADGAVSGRCVPDLNTIFINPKRIQNNTVLHEAIHAVTSYYLNASDKTAFPKEIQAAIKEINYCYDLLKQDFIEKHFYEDGKLKDGVDVDKAFNFWITGEQDLYGYTSPIEMIAEITNPEFVAHIKDYDNSHKDKKSVFQRLIDAIFKLFNIRKEYKSVEGTIKNALLTLVNNPSQEALTRYSNEVKTAKENLDTFDKVWDNTVSFRMHNAAQKALNEASDIAESNGKNTIELFIPQEWVEYGFINIPKDSHGALTNPHRNTLLNFPIREAVGRGVLTAPLEKTTVNGEEGYKLQFFPFTLSYLKTHKLDIKINDNNVAYVDNFVLEQKAEEDGSTQIDAEKVNQEQKVPNTSVTTIISGIQTGVDTLGLEVAQELGLKTGGTAPRGFLRESNVDTKTADDFRNLGVIEITPEQQSDYTKRTGKADPYTARTELNVRNSDGTVYFSTSVDNAGKIATSRAAKEWGKPFLLNPTAQMLRDWIKENNIKVLNVAGNRGSKLMESESIKQVLIEALTNSALDKTDTVFDEQETQDAPITEQSKAVDVYDVTDQNREYLERQAAIRRQVDALTANPLFTMNEIRNEGIAFANWISDTLNEYEANPEKAIQNFGLNTTAEKIKDKSRIELFKLIGIDNLINYYKNYIYSYGDVTQGQGNPYLAEASDELLDKVDALRENFDAIVQYSLAKLKENEGVVFNRNNNKGVEESDSEVIDDPNGVYDTEEIQETEGSEQEHWQIETNTLDFMENGSKPVKQALNQAYELIPTGKMNPDGTPEYVNATDEYGRNKRISVRDAANSIYHWVEGSLDLKGMVDVLKEKAKTNPWLTQIVSRLEDTSGKEAIFQSLFFKDFYKPFRPYKIGIKDTKTGKFYTKSINEQPAMKEAYNNVVAQYRMGVMPLVGLNGVDRGNLQTLTDIVGQLYNIKGITNKTIGDAINLVQRAAALFGFAVDTTNPSRILNDETFKTIKYNLSRIADSLGKEIGNESYNPFKYSEQNSIIRYTQNLLTPLTTALEETHFSSIYTAGKMRQSYVTPSFTIKLMQKFRGTDEVFWNTIMNEYANSEWYVRKVANEVNNEWKQKSNFRTPWLRELAGMDQATRKKMFGFHQLTEFNGKMYMKTMTPQELVVANIVEYLSESSNGKDTPIAWYRIPMTSNKQAAEFISFIRYTGDNYKRTIVDGFKEIFDQELSRIQTVMLRDKKEGQTGYIQNFDKRGKEFCILDFFNDYVKGIGINELVNSELGKLLNDKIAGNAVNEARLSELVKEEIHDHYDEKAQEAVREYNTNGIAATLREKTNAGERTNEIIEEFIWNDAFAAANILEIFVTDPAYYKDSEDLQKRLAQLHSPGLRGNAQATDFDGKPVTDGKIRTMYIKDHAKFTSNVIDNISIVFDKKIAEAPESEKLGYKALRDNVIEMFQSINVTDGQAFLSPTSARKIGFIYGTWSTKHEEIYNKIKNGEANLTDLETVFQPRKPFTYTKISKPSGAEGAPISTLNVPTQNKNSEYLLIMADALMQGTDTGRPNILKALFDFMEDTAKTNPTTGIDVIQFESSVKSGLFTPVDLNEFLKDADGEKKAFKRLNKARNNDYSSYVHEISLEDYAEQTNVPEHFRDARNIEGSQERAIIPSDLPEFDALGNVVKFEFEDNGIKKSLTAAEFKREWEENRAATIRLDLDRLAEELCLGPEYSKLDRNTALSRILEEEIINNISRYGIDLHQACQIDEQTGEFVIPLGDPVQARRIEQLINSVIKSRINKQKVAGGTLVQVTSWGTSKSLDTRFNDKKGNLLPKKSELLAKGMTEEQIKAYYEKNQGGIAHFEALAPAWAKDVFRDFMNPITGELDIESIEMLAPDALEMLGFRIPTEDKYSIFPIKIVGTLPKEAGDAIMLPYDVTTLSGCDFDVDKENMLRRIVNFNINKITNTQAAKEIVKQLGDFDVPLTDKDRTAIENKVGRTFDSTIERLDRQFAEREDKFTREYNSKFDQLEKTNASDEEFNALEDKYNSSIKALQERKNRELDAINEKRKKAIEDETKKFIGSKRFSYVKDVIETEIFNDSSRISEEKDRKLFQQIKQAYLNLKYDVSYPTEGKDYHNNKMLDMAKAVLSHPEIAPQMLNPQSFDPVKKVGYLVTAIKEGAGSYESLKEKSINELKKLSYKKKNLIDFNTHVQFYKQNSVAGQILGMFAIQKTAHAILCNDGFTIDAEEPFTIMGKDFGKNMVIDQMHDSDKEYIGRVLGMLVSASADAVKDPVLNLMNINNTTVNVLTTAIRLGMPFEDIAMMLSTNVITEALNTYNSKSLDGYVTFNSVIDSMIAEMDVAESSKLDTEELTDSEIIHAINNTNTSIDYKILKNYQRLSKMAEDLRPLTMATRYNSVTSAAGPLIVDNLIQMYKSDRFSENVKLNGTAASISDVFRLHPSLAEFSRGYDIAEQIFRQMPAGSAVFRRDVLGMTHTEDVVNESLRRTIMTDRKILGKLVDFFTSYLLVDSGVVEATNEKLKYYIEQFPKDFMKVGREGKTVYEKYPNNPFIQAIKIDSRDTDGGVEFFLKIDVQTNDQEAKDKLMAGWAQLHKENPRLSKMIFDYNFFRGGIGFSPKTFMHLLPSSVKAAIEGYNKAFTDISGVYGPKIIDMFIRNNWDNSKLVPYAKTEKVKGDDGKERTIIKGSTSEGIGIISFNGDNYENAPKGAYFKAKIFGTEKLYKCIENNPSERYARYQETTPLGDNGSYLEFGDVAKNSVPLRTTKVSIAETENFDLNQMDYDSIERTERKVTNKEIGNVIKEIDRIDRDALHDVMNKVEGILDKKNISYDREETTKEAEKYC